MGKGKVVYQNHHPDRDKFPDWTIPLRKWMHMYVRRLEQFKATPDNLKELYNLKRAITYIYDKMLGELTNDNKA